MDAKLQDVLLDYGLEGYGLYWYCIELIVSKVDQDNVTFSLEHDARIIARNVGSTPQKVEEMMRYFVKIGLFEGANGIITCLKLAKRLDKSMVSNPQMREIISNLKNHDSIMTNDDKIMIQSWETMQDKNRLDKNRIYRDLSLPEEVDAPITIEVKQKKPRATVPYQAIWDLYQETLVNTGEAMSLVSVVKLTDKRKTKIRKYWTENCNKGLDGVQAYFEYIWNNRQSHSWLFGCAGKKWKADIEYLLREDTVTRARENTLANWSSEK